MEAFVTSTFCCPITRRLMRDPVITQYGISYERDALIREWTNNGDALELGLLQGDVGLDLGASPKSNLDAQILVAYKD